MLVQTVLLLHVAFFIGACLMFSASGIVSILFMYHEKRIKQKRPLIKIKLLPSLGAMTMINVRAIVAGFILSSMGLLCILVLKALISEETAWAKLRNGLPVFTWTVYALMILLFLFRGLGGRSMALAAIIGCVSVMITFAHEILALSITP